VIGIHKDYARVCLPPSLYIHDSNCKRSIYHVNNEEPGISLEPRAAASDAIPAPPVGFLAGRGHDPSLPRLRHSGARGRPAPRESPVLPGGLAEIKLFNSPRRPSAQRTYLTLYNNAHSRPIPPGRDTVGLFIDPRNEIGS
jgi:hypothetical protein